MKKQATENTACFDYHHLTSYQRSKMPRHFLDWENQPSVFKTYPGAERIQLPRDVRHREDSLSMILKSQAPMEKRRDPDMADLSRIFSLAYGITRKGTHRGGYHYYRSVASAGALYPTEIYVSTNGAQGLDDGLYHFSIAHHALTPLRKGDVSSHVADAVRPTLHKSPKLTFFLSAIFFRSAWKYMERSYRYHLLDTGHLLENLVVALKAQKFPFEFSFDFDDHTLNRLLGLDETKEVCLAVCYMPGEHPVKRMSTEEEIANLSESVKNTSIVSQKETDYPAVLEIHEQGLHETARSGVELPTINPVDLKSEKPIDVTGPEIWPEKLNYEGAFLHRRSKRNYVPKSISLNHLASLVQALSLKDRGAHSDALYYQNTVRSGLIVGNAQGIDPGFYLLDEAKGSLGLVNSGHFLDMMTHICLDQKWLANAAVHFVFLTDIEVLDRYYGARGYRYAMMVSGRMGERLYLSATAMGLGCCGIGAFYDFEASQLLGLTRTSRLLYLVAVGPVKSQIS
ncbi:MAG: SagB/ThcOx family dehydrogenase [Deltaproteobacteria bacterium]|nr:SagB/ThcOx family dehydrogenase [Deltaproteobacteria bacterium]